MGFGAGAVQGAVALLLLLGGLLVLEPIELQKRNAQRSQSMPPSRVSETILTVTQQTHDSKLGPIIEG